MTLEEVTRELRRIKEPPRALDPALKKLLDNLPQGDPDAKPPERVEVWIAFCDGGPQVVPNGVRVERIDYGRWRGPEMDLDDVMIHLRNLDTGGEAMVRWGDTGGAHLSGPLRVSNGVELVMHNAKVTCR